MAQGSLLVNLLKESEGTDASRFKGSADRFGDYGRDRRGVLLQNSCLDGTMDRIFAENPGPYSQKRTIRHDTLNPTLPEGWDPLDVLWS